MTTQLIPPSVMKNANGSSNVIDLNEMISNSLGLPYEIVREAAPMVFEISLRMREVMQEVVDENYPTDAALALAQAMASVMIIETMANHLELDPDDLLIRLLEAGHRGLFDIAEGEASDGLTELFNRFEKITEETEE